MKIWQMNKNIVTTPLPPVLFTNLITFFIFLFFLTYILNANYFIHFTPSASQIPISNSFSLFWVPLQRRGEQRKWEGFIKKRSGICPLPLNGISERWESQKKGWWKITIADTLPAFLGEPLPYYLLTTVFQLPIITFQFSEV